MDLSVYEALANCSVSWICIKCGLPNFTDSFFSTSNVTVSNSYSILSTDSDLETNTSHASCNSSGPKSPPLAASSPRATSGVHINRTTPGNNNRPAKRSNLKVLVINFQGITGKISELACCIDTNNPDVIIGTETHVDCSINSSELFPPQYQIVRKDSDFGSAVRGGVLIAVKNDLIATHRIDLDSNCEVVWISISVQGMKQIIVGAFYRSHQFGNTTEYLDQLRDSLSKIKRSNRSHIWLAGDFNLPGVDWDSQSVTPNSQYVGLSKHMLEIAADFGLEQMVTKPTRGKNILDLFFTNNPTLVERFSLIPGLSDHDGIPMIIVSSKPKVIKTKPRKVFLYQKADVSAIRNDLKQFSDTLTSSDPSSCSVSDLWADFEKAVKNSMDSHIPTRMVSKRNLTPWIGRNK
ncbi:uncharacterized protein [Amphiura filiformis]|uniref:uncharacterized protein n=1 Tax=Amphiura filiformis TaxID=82378 RepID=UPI003B227BDB